MVVIIKKTSMRKTRNIQRPVYFLLALGALFMFLSASCSEVNVIRGDGQLSVSEKSLSPFQAIELQGMFNVILQKGHQPMVRLETDQNLMELIEIRVKDHTLLVETQKDAALRPTKMDLLITYQDLNQLVIAGAGKVSATEVLQAGSFLLNISGAADVELSVEIGELSTRVSGAGNIRLQGQTDNHQVDLSGASNLRAEELLTDHTRISLSGAGAAHVYARSSLHANISGVGKITYYGDPDEKVINQSGLGVVRQAQ